MRMPFPMLGCVLALACATTAPPSSSAVAAVDDVIVAPDTVLIPGVFPLADEPDGNSIIVRGRDGLIVFDTGRDPEHTQRILDYAKATGLPIVAIVNSHWHLDHVSGNVMLREAYPQAHVYAAHAIEGAMTGFLANERKQLEDMIAKHQIPEAQLPAQRAEIARIDSGSRLSPDMPSNWSAGVRTIAGRRLQLGLTHDVVTAGDVWIYDPATHVLLSGDLVTLPAPLLDTACAAHWSTQLALLDAVPFKTLVPGHGAPMDHAHFDRYRVAYDNLLACSAGKGSSSACIEGWLRDAGDLVPGTDQKLARSLLDYDVDKVLRAPPARRGRYCGMPA